MRFLLTVLAGVMLATSAHALNPCDLEDRAKYVSIAKRYEKGLLFRLSHCEMPDSYAFGTYHSDDPLLQPIFQHVLQTLPEVSHLLLELDINQHTRGEVRRRMQLPADQRLSDRLEPRLLARTVQAATSLIGLPQENIERLKPWAISVLLQYPKPKADGVVLDEQLKHQAAKMGIKIHGLETVEEQFSFFESLTRDDETLMLEDALNELEKGESDHAELREAYLNQDLGRLYRLSRKVIDQMKERQPRLGEGLEREIILARNKRMAKRVLPYLNEPSLIAVGALHLAGAKGLLPLLEKEGFFVEAVKQPE